MTVPPSTAASPALAHFETLFHAATVDLLIPDVTATPVQPSVEATYTQLEEWWKKVEGCSTRGMAFFDEKLFYLVSLSLPGQALSNLNLSPVEDGKIPSELQRFISRLQLTMTASFVPPHTSLQPRPERISSLKPADNLSTPTPSTAALAPPSPGPSDQPYLPESGDSRMPPVTPNPFPAMAAEESQYATVEGITVWEGPVEEGLLSHDENQTTIEDGRIRKRGATIFRVGEGWQMVWRGELPVAYVRTPIPNPLISLTASVTLRDRADQIRSHRKRAFSVASTKSGTETIRTQETEREESDVGEEDGDDMAGMEDIDLLGGLAGVENQMPGTRLPPSLRTDLSIAPPSPASAVPSSAGEPMSNLSYNIPSASSGPSRERGHLPPTTIVSPLPSTTLRKSYRRILSLSSGLKVRMRTLFLPQLLPPRQNTHDQSDMGTDEEGERRVVLCVEIENTVTGSLENGFQVEKVIVEVGGKGGKATPELFCQPEQQLGNHVFPLRLCSVEQYNLLYAVSIASSPEPSGSSGGLEEAVAKSLGRGDEQRPVSITIIGKPFLVNSEGNDGDLSYPTSTFHSRWNCNLDLTAFYASLAASPSNPIPPLASSSPAIPGKNRSSRPVTLTNPPNAIAGDKRYSLASLLSTEPNSSQVEPNRHPPQRRVVSGISQRPLMPSQMMNTNNSNGNPRIPSYRAKPPTSLNTGGGGFKNPNFDIEGLLLSVRILPQRQGLMDDDEGNSENGSIQVLGMMTTIKALEPFSVEVFVHNRTDQVRRFRLSVPGRDVDGISKKVREVWDKTRKRGLEEPIWGIDDGILKQLFSEFKATCPALIPLENDVRCGPLLPGASLSARLRFMALRDGVHSIDRLRVTAVGGVDEFDFVMTPVLEVVVGKGQE